MDILSRRLLTHLLQHFNAAGRFPGLYDFRAPFAVLAIEGEDFRAFRKPQYMHQIMGLRGGKRYLRVRLDIIRDK